MNLGNFY